MPPSKAPNGRTGRPPVTSRAEILAAARRLIDQDSWERLTVRKLAAELGIGTTTLYHHVRDKEDLLLLVLNEYAGQLPRPELPAGPQDRIVAAATFLHDAFATWPWAVEVLTADGFVGLLDDAALWPVEAIVAAAIDAGCTQQQAVVAFRSIWYYTVGEILVRARSPHRPVTGAELHFDFPANLDPAQTPHLTAIGADWKTYAAADTYPHGLRALVNGLLPSAT
ncbi:TetR/AcrR family transcriptional regulator [Kribbella sp. NPDC005582]|uniref:TetR/AcrR family transcriptional regulator n=1 Tax=Kribbella sp. NPDC005582 TaxID=3156893 RepID=UPI0033BAEDC3